MSLFIALSYHSRHRISNKTHTKRENITSRTRNISITHVLHFIKKLKYVPVYNYIYIFNIVLQNHYRCLLTYFFCILQWMITNQ